MFRHVFANQTMMKPYQTESVETSAVEPFADNPQPESAPAAGLRDAAKLFETESRRTTLLDPSEEVELARRVARARSRIQRLLGRARSLCRAALDDAGRGALMPDDGFREREAVAVLRLARRLSRTAHPERAVRLSRTALRTFAKELSTALDEYRVLRDRMLQANIRLVGALARKYDHPSLGYLDFVQEGALGLVRAIEKYEPDRQVKFATYAVFWIRQHMSRFADNHGALIRSPVHWSQLRRRFERGAPAGDVDVSPDDWAEAQGIDCERFEEMRQTFTFQSTSAPLGDDDERTLEGLLSSGGQGPEESILGTDLRERLLRAAAQLPPREREIVRRRFGLEGNQCETLGEIGGSFGLSRERIRQLEQRALGHLRELCVAQGIDAYLQ
jgi:RNA polymerase sigma factor (sigma-70 family)